MKKAENDDNLVLRLFETEGNAVSAEINLNPEIFGKIRKVMEVDLLERPVSGSADKINDHSFNVDMPPNGITTVKLDFKRRNK
jgi:alpha-mannosidase